MVFNMETKQQFKQIMQSLKLQLKEQKVSYAKLAKELDLSESSIKKLFTGVDCTIGKVVSICNFLNINVNEVLKYSELEENPAITIDKDIQDFFTENIKYYKVFWLLTNDRLDPPTIQKEYGIEQSELANILEYLSDHKLISYRAFDDVTAPKADQFEYTKDSDFIRERNKSLAQDLSERIFFTRKFNENAQYNFLSAKFIEEDFIHLKNDLDYIIEKYRIKSQEELNTHPDTEMINYSFYYSVYKEAHTDPIEPLNGMKYLRKYD
jgi:DNA-binding Xre family transcriptional regulator